MLTRHLAHTLVKDNITVNAIAPGLFPSKMTQFVFDGLGEEGAASNIPMRAAQVVRTTSPAPPSTYRRGRDRIWTGAIIPVDGGFSTHWTAASGQDRQRADCLLSSQSYRKTDIPTHPVCRARGGGFSREWGSHATNPRW